MKYWGRESCKLAPFADKNSTIAHKPAYSSFLVLIFAKPPLVMKALEQTRRRTVKKPV